MTRLLIFVLLFFPLSLFAQRDFLVVIEGSVENLLDQQKVYGVAIDIMQKDAVLTKVLSNEAGEFFASAKIMQGQPIQLRFTKGGYQTKFILFDLTTLQGQVNKPNGLQLIRNLVCQLYALQPDVDLSFSKDQVTDKYVWSSGALVQIPLVKTDADQKARAAYQNAKDLKKYNQLVSSANKALAAQDQDRALLYLDSILALRPADNFANQNKTQILNDRAAALKKTQDQAKQATLLNEAIQAREAGNLELALTKINEANALIANNSAVLQELARVNQLIEEAKNAKSINESFERAMTAALSFFNAKKYDEAERKYLEAQQIKPTEKDRVNSQLQIIQDIKFDIKNEKDLKLTMNLANEQFKQKKYDLALETYKKADSQIALFHKQSLIDTYSKELQLGMTRVNEGINSMSQVYLGQLAKANENFNKGEKFYPTARTILSSDPMKSRQDEPEVIALIQKLDLMEAYYREKNAAYSLVKNKENAAACSALEKVLTAGQQRQQYLNAKELSSIQFSIDSLRGILTPNVPNKVKEDVVSEPSGIRLTAPGERVTGDNSMAFNDFQAGREAKLEEPYRIQQQIRTEVEYQNYFSQQNAQIGSFETAAQLEMTRAQRELNERQNSQNQEQLQLDQAKQAQAHDAAIQNREADAALRQQENAENIQAWRDAKDHQDQLTTKQNEERQGYELNRLNQFQNELDLKAQEEQDKAEQNTNEMNARQQQVEFVKQNQTETAVVQGQAQYEKIQQIGSTPLQLKTTPNYLRDENGVLFPKNSFTETTFKLKNNEGFITKVVVRRVVVDPNGYGIVYEQITDENGKIYFTRDGQVSTEYVWFNDSTGANVLIK